MPCVAPGNWFGEAANRRESPEAFEASLDIELNRLRQQLINGTYQPQPVRRYYVKKASGRDRPISIWAIRDRVLQRVIADYLTPIFEAMFLDCSYGFRPGRSVEDAVNTVVQYRDMGRRWVLDTDIEDCFGSIDLQFLLGQLEAVVETGWILQLVNQWLYAPIEGHKNRTAGVSQGGVISPLLANLYLHRFDQMMTAALPRSKLIRFADDLVVLNRTKVEAIWSLAVARRSLENLRMKLNEDKTRVTNFDEGFDFLGVRFLGVTCQRNGDEPDPTIADED